SAAYSAAPSGEFASAFIAVNACVIRCSRALSLGHELCKVPNVALGQLVFSQRQDQVERQCDVLNPGGQRDDHILNRLEAGGKHLRLAAAHDVDDLPDDLKRVGHLLLHAVVV